VNLPRGWISSTIGDVFLINPKHPTETDRRQLVSFVAMPSVDEHTGTITAAVDRILDDVWSGYTHFADGDVIFAKITPCMENGKAAVARGMTNSLACGSTEFYVLRADGAAVPEFLWRYLRQKSFRDDAENHMSGAVGQQRVPKRYLEDYSLPLPPLVEQRRIIAKLDVLTARLACARAELDKAKFAASKLRSAILSTEFRLSGELVHPTKALGDITTRITKGSSPRWQGFEYQTKGTLFVRSQNVGWGRLTLEDPVYLPPEFNEKCSNSVIQKNDVLLNIVGASIGRATIASEEVVGANCNQAVAIIRPASADDAKYIMYFLISPTTQVAINDNSVDVARANFSLAQAKSLRVPWPSSERRIASVERIEAAFARADRLEVEAIRLSALLDRLESAILAKAFRGELVPQDPNDQPASDLLDRIRAQRASAPRERHRPRSGRRAMA
jgi:type I restriction enzyme, S subunit